ncbi:hypothetical protein F444_22490 [Phytophthora nicotianae P1976]|uniref:Uncharacterized protein n=1 Tax=Phytophthora nicotianae P1976 TaxID=1317066 RepID=A0A080YXM5_PHYNI|nr:hypothetical protein F444_22490 [Phytophthora nicotianae P1976]
MRYLDRLDIETAAKVKQAAVTLPKAPGPDGVILPVVVMSMKPQ